MRMRGCPCALILVALVVLSPSTPAWAQQTEKRSDVEFMPVGPPPEVSARPWGLYDFSFSVELGGQLVDVDGNHEVYESHLNYRDGFKVFAFDMQGRGQGDAFFNNFYVRGGGWGSEPYSWVHFGFGKNKWFDFRGSFRESEYNWFFPGFARSQHFNDIERRFQNYRLTLLPGRRFRPKLGYSRNSSFGPSYNSLDFSRGEFPAFEPIRQTYDEYTIGAEWNVQRWLIAGEYGYRFFRNDRFQTIIGSPSLPNDPADAAFLNVFDRLTPSRGRIPFYRLNIVGRPHKTLEVNARAVYSRARTLNTRDEFLSGRSYRSAGRTTTLTEDMAAVAEVIRPMTTIDGNVTWRPVRRLIITNNFQYRGYDIAGFQRESRDVFCGTPIAAGCPLDTTTSTRALQNFFASTFFDLDTFQERFEAHFEVTDWLSVRGGLFYLDRNWKFFEFESEAEGGVLLGTDTHSENIGAINRAWLAGLVLKPDKRVHIFFDMENGDFTRVFNRQMPAELDRYRLRGRFEPWEGIRFNGSWFIFDNQNFRAPTAANPKGRHSSRNRGGTFDFQLARFERGYFNAGYSRNDITAITDVVLPGATGGGGVFLYVLDENYFYVDGGGRISGKFYVDAGYRLVDSSGSFPPSDPVGACVPFTVQQCDNRTLDPFLIFSGGVKYHQPHVGVRYSFSDNVNWKFGWRYYDYNQQGGKFSDYNTHIFTSSVVLNF